MMAKDFFDVFSSYGLTVISLFVLMVQVPSMRVSRKRLFNAAYKFMGHIPGGLAMAYRRRSHCI
jgi:TRAP-type C4-dicarboxylate transport system permease large subunit